MHIDNIQIANGLSSRNPSPTIESTRKSLFHWSKSSTSTPLSDCRIVLPHIPDSHQSAHRNNEASSVLCIDISPNGNVLVTGCGDGVARLWRFGETGVHITNYFKILIRIEIRAYIMQE
jgi:WD40 repeat protein